MGKTRQDKRAISAYILFMSVYPFSRNNLEGETWKWVKDYDGIYKISNYSRIKSYQKGTVRIIKPALSDKGYLHVCLSKFGEHKNCKVHRLVAQAFVPNPDNLPEVDHINGDKLNCTATNLRWTSHRENIHYAREMAYSKHLEDDNMKVNSAPDTSADLVFIRNNQALTDSRKVAEYFGKRHDNVIRDIRELIEQIGGLLKNEESLMFVEGTYINQQNKQQPMYYMNRDGFTLLAMGFTGKEALQFKLAYIAKFNEMERALSNLKPVGKESELAFLKQAVKMIKSDTLRDKYFEKILALIENS